VANLVDSLGEQTRYHTSVEAGSWFATASEGSGCASCSMRGEISNQPDANGNLLSSTDALGHTTSYTYDANNNVATKSAAVDANTTATNVYTYNSFGEVLTMTDPLGHVASNTYDSHGNLLTVTTPAPNGTTAASVTQFAYDSSGELTSITDPLSQVTSIAYTSAGLVHTITDAQSHVTTPTHDLIRWSPTPSLPGTTPDTTKDHQISASYAISDGTQKGRNPVKARLRSILLPLSLVHE
jgi:YD repeat-containing protein